MTNVSAKLLETYQGPARLFFENGECLVVPVGRFYTCAFGLAFNVDASPAGDGVLLSKDRRTLILAVNHDRHGIRCMAKWATRRGLQAKYEKL